MNETELVERCGKGDNLARKQFCMSVMPGN